MPNIDLPDWCFAQHPITGHAVVITRGVIGYKETQFKLGDASVLNCRIGVSDEEAEEMLRQSMSGWRD